MKNYESWIAVDYDCLVLLLLFKLMKLVFLQSLLLRLRVMRKRYCCCYCYWNWYYGYCWVLCNCQLLNSSRNLWSLCPFCLINISTNVCMRGHRTHISFWILKSDTKVQNYILWSLSNSCFCVSPTRSFCGIQPPRSSDFELSEPVLMEYSVSQGSVLDPKHYAKDDVAQIEALPHWELSQGHRVRDAPEHAQDERR